ncbi:MAG TPA: efflux RND transporter periplasmic adaptor subunit [Acidobacteriaceae bacterium]|jgi:HlyD family secretion protein|nr:efflux RND transporter periplasmic adaptor subunit [Acidobacteriaceae bacterium]
MATKQKGPNTARIWIITTLALILVFYGVHLLTRGKLPIRVATATMGNLISTVATNGKVEPEPQANYEAHAPFPGIVQSVYVHEGEKVPAGKLLLAMDDTEARARVATALAALRGAEAAEQASRQGGTQQERLSLGGDLAKAKIDRDQAQQDLQALQKLQASGAASPSEVASAKGRLAADNSGIQVLEERQTHPYTAMDLAHAQANLQDAQAGYEAALDALHHAIVHAPFAGTVYSLPVARTEFVQQGDRLLSMGDLTKLEVRAYFDEPEIGKLQVGQPVSIAWDARPNERWHGRILRLPSTIIAYGTRNVGEGLVSIDDNHDALLPDTNVRVTVTVANESNVLTVPHDALHFEQGASYVYRLEGDTLHRTPVTVGTVNLTDVQIASGLKAGDKVALNTTNGQPLSDGVPVEVVQ